MEINSPKPSTIELKINDRIICVRNDSKYKWAYMIKGKVKWVGIPKNMTDQMYGIEFDKNVKSKDDCKPYFKCKTGTGCLLRLKDLYSFTKSFDIKSFQRNFEKMKKKRKKDKEFLKIKKDAERRQSNLSNSDLLTNKSSHSINDISENKENNDKEDKKKKETSNDNLPEKKKSKEVKAPSQKLDLKLKKKSTEIIMEEEEEVESIELNEELDMRNSEVLNSKIPEIMKYSTIQDDGNMKKLLDENKKLMEENKKNYISTKKIQMQITDLSFHNNILEKTLVERNTEIKLLKENLSQINSMENPESSNNVKTMEELTDLKLELSNARNEKEDLHKKLDKYKNFDEFKKKFEKISIDYETCKMERDDYKLLNDENDLIIKELNEQLEIYEIEAELAGTNENIPDNMEDLKKNYMLLQKAFQKLDLDMQIQKEENEIRCEELNNEISNLSSKYQNILTSEEVQGIINKKNDEIKELHSLIDQYSKSNKMVESMIENEQKKEEKILKLKNDLLNTIEKLNIFEEENLLYEEINLELEESGKENIKKITELEESIKEEQEQKRLLKEKIEKYSQKVEDLHEEKTNLEFETSQISEETEKYSSLYQEYNKEVQTKQNKIKEKMTFKMHGKNSFWEAIKWKLYFKSIPDTLTDNLNIEYFDKFKRFCVINDKIDIILENLSVHYLLNENLQSDNLNLFGAVKDLFSCLVDFQNFLNILRELYLKSGKIEEIQELEGNLLYIEINLNFHKIDEIYVLLRNNEFSASFCYSAIMESIMKLKLEIKIEDYKEYRNVYLKYLLNQILEKLIPVYSGSSTNNNTKDIIKSLIPKIFYLHEQLFELKIEERINLKIEKFSEDIIGNLADFRFWFDSFYKEIEKNFLSEEEVREKLNNGIWAKNIGDLKQSLVNFEKIKLDLKISLEDKKKLEEKVGKKIQDIENAKILKMNLESKILKLQTRANNASTLELELSEIRKIEKNQSEKIQKYKEKIKEIEQKLSEGGPIQNVLKNSENSKNFGRFKKKTKSVKIFKDEKQIKAFDYKPGVKFEINSLNSVVSNLMSELKYYKEKDCYKKLDDVKKNSPSFGKILNKYKKEHLKLPVVKESLNYLNNNKYLMKKEISKLSVIDMSEKNNTFKGIQDYYHVKKLMNSFYINSKYIVEDSMKFGKEIKEIGYDILKKEINKDKKKINYFYGKLKILDTEPNDLLIEKNDNVFNLELKIK